MAAKDQEVLAGQPGIDEKPDTENTHLMQGGTPPWRKGPQVIATESTRTFKGQGKTKTKAKDKGKGGSKSSGSRREADKGGKRSAPWEKDTRRVRRRHEKPQDQEGEGKR